MRLFLQFLFLLVGFSGYTQTVRTYANAGTFTWVCPFDVNSITVECWGGGGAGGAATGTNSSGGGGAGGGYVYNASIPVVPNNSYIITVGAGGVGSTTVVNAGGSSWFGSVTTILAVGGNGGAIASAASSFSAGGAFVSTGNINGTISNYGGAGGIASLTASGGGGGSASTSAGVNGNNGFGITGGVAVTGGGAGADGRTNNGIGVAGGIPGAGGSGGKTSSTTDRRGGNGAKGKVVITYTSAGIVWNGTGVSGGVVGTDFNTAANWLPTTVPGPSDVAIINTTATVTIALSASVQVGTLTLLNNATGNVTLSLDLGIHNLTVNDDILLNINPSGAANTACYVRVGSGDLDVNGNALFGNNANTASRVGIIGNANPSTGNCRFYGDVTFGANYNPTANCFGSFIWDGLGTQTVVVNRAVTLNASCQIGGVNTPTVTFPSSNGFGVQVRSTAAPGNLTIKNGSTLELTSRTFNRQAAGGSLILEGNSILIVGSTFPANFSTVTMASTSGVEYNGTSAQTIFDVASPGYGMLTLADNSTKTAATALDIQNTFTISAASTFDAGTSLTHNLSGDWVVDGGFTYTTDNTINLVGSSTQNIGGSSTPSLYNLTNTNTGSLVVMQGDILVSNSLSMAGTSANIDLNGFTIDLSTTGSLTGESESDHIYGSSGSIKSTRVLNAPTSDNVGGLGCVLTSAENLGSTVIIRGHSSQSGVGISSFGSVERYYSISPTNNSALNATMVFNYFDSELGAMNEADLKLYRSVDGGANWMVKHGTLDATANTLTLSGIAAFSIWTSSTPGAVVLPIELITFEGSKNDRSNDLNWVTMTEINNDYFIVERSLDGEQFEFLHEVEGAGTSSIINSYTFSDENFQPTINYYRLKQTDFDGKFTYSDLISIDNRIVTKSIDRIVNLYGQVVDAYYKGPVIVIYSDNSILRTVQL